MPSFNPTVFPSSYQGSDYGYISMSYDPAAATTTSTALTPAGKVFTVRLPVRTRSLVTNIVMWVQTAGATLTAGQCIAGLYQNNTLLSSTADQATNWASTGAKTMALTAAQDVSPGFVDVAFYYNGTTGPAFMRTAATAGNLALTTTSIRNATADTARTTTLAATLGTKTASAVTYWAAIS